MNKLLRDTDLVLRTIDQELDTNDLLRRFDQVMDSACPAYRCDDLDDCECQDLTILVSYRWRRWPDINPETGTRDSVVQVCAHRISLESWQSRSFRNVLPFMPNDQVMGYYSGGIRSNRLRNYKEFPDLYPGWNVIQRFHGVYSQEDELAYRLGISEWP